MYVNNNFNDKFVQNNKVITHMTSSDSYKKLYYLDIMQQNISDEKMHSRVSFNANDTSYVALLASRCVAVYELIQ